MEILLIEDIYEYARRIMDLLSHEYPECSVTHCWNMSQFLEMFDSENTFILVITDMTFPLGELETAHPLITEKWEDQKAGEKVVEHIRVTRGCPVPIIIQSNTSSVYYPNALAHAGVVACGKSLTRPRGLADQIRKVLSQQ